MTMKDRLFYSVVAVLLSLIVVIGINKFYIGKKQANSPRMENPEEIIITNLDNTQVTLASLLKEPARTYILILEIYNCSSCIYKGLSELESLTKEGEECFCLVVHDWPQEVAGWSQHYDYQRFVHIKKAAFYQYFHSPYLPVLLKIENKKIKSSRYISQ